MADIQWRQQEVCAPIEILIESAKTDRRPLWDIAKSHTLRKFGTSLSITWCVDEQSLKRQPHLLMQ